MGSAVRFRMLGVLEAYEGGRWRGLGAPKQRALLAALLINAGRVVPQENIVAELWGEEPPKGVVNQVHGSVMRLRRALGDQGGRLLVTRAPGYLLAIDSDEVDVEVFRSSVEAGRTALDQGDAERAVAELKEGLRIWRGPALADVPPTPLVQAEVARLEELRLTAVETHVEADLTCGRHAEVVAELSPLVREHPLRERLWGRLMVALYRSGRQADALAAFERLRRLLDAELGVLPEKDIQRLHRQILAGDPALDLPVPAPRAPSTGPPRQLPADADIVTGRAQYLRAMDALIPEGHPPRAGVSVVTGQAGVGKTAFMVRWAHRVAHRFPDGQLYVNLQGHTADPALRPTEALGQMLHALGLAPDKVPVDSDEATMMYRTMMADKRVLILLDDAEAAEQVRPLLPGSPACLTVVTSRNRLSGLVAREGAHRLTLDALSAIEALTLLARLLGSNRVGAELEAAAELARLCAYLPLPLRAAAANLADCPSRLIEGYVAELCDGDPLAALRVCGDDRSAIETALNHSYRRLLRGERHLFRLIGAMPRADITVGTAAALLGLVPERTIEVLERLAAVHMVEEVGPGRFALHDLLRRYARKRADIDMDDQALAWLDAERADIVGGPGRPGPH